jgi:ATP-dependent Clp protease, protease subunit
MTKRNLPAAAIGARPGVKTDIATRAFSRWNPDVRAAVDDQDAPTIEIMDVIGYDFWDDGVTAKSVSNRLRAVGKRDVTVVINSPGGDYFEGLAIYNTLREHPAQVTVKIIGLAASAAAVIAMAGDQVQIARAGFLMVHNAWVMAIGDRHALREVSDWLEPFDGAAVDIFAARTGMDSEAVGKMLDVETWIGGAAAIDQGFADTFLPSDEIASGAEQSTGRDLRAERRFDLLAAKAGLKRSEARELLASLKGGMPGAAPTGMQDAAVTREVEGLLNRLKRI